MSQKQDSVKWVYALLNIKNTMSLVMAEFTDGILTDVRNLNSEEKMEFYKNKGLYVMQTPIPVKDEFEEVFMAVAPFAQVQMLGPKEKLAPVSN
jgi:hypothetical protein